MMIRMRKVIVIGSMAARAPGASLVILTPRMSVRPQQRFARPGVTPRSLAFCASILARRPALCHVARMPSELENIGLVRVRSSAFVRLESLQKGGATFEA